MKALYCITLFRCTGKASGSRETIGEDGDEMTDCDVKRRVGGCCVRFAWRCLPFYSYFIVNVPANIIAGFSLYISIINTGTSKV